LRIDDATPTVHALRRLKEPGEIAAIERALAVTAEAIGAGLGAARAGVAECELEAEHARVYRRHGARHAFDPIVGSGANAHKLHYKVNSGRLAAGQLLLLDTGAMLDGYGADITRTFPVDGRFSDRQREVYEVVLDAQRVAIDQARPGALLGEIHARAFEVIDRAGFGAQFVHGTGHHLGLEVHDVGDVHEPLAAGAVITVEPGIYLPDEGFGVRIEDDVLVGPGGPRVLGPGIPRSVDEIERAMGRR
jgi:Xaa-Pro aminopeptidase